MFRMHRVNSRICLIKKSRSGVFVESSLMDTKMSRTNSTEDLIFDLDLDLDLDIDLDSNITCGIGKALHVQTSMDPDRLEIECVCPREKLRDIYQRRKEALAHRQRIIIGQNHTKSNYTSSYWHHSHPYQHQRIIGFDIKNDFYHKNLKIS